MSEQPPRPPTREFWREEVLRRAGQALQGRVVGLWEATDDSVVPIAISHGRPLPPTAAKEINEAMRRWRIPIPTGSRWLACRLDMGRWCIAPVRSDIPAPPPGGMERRKKERMALELAGLCLGLIEERAVPEPGHASGPPGAP
ncbi:MAG: hypothetical protein ABSB58_09405 [Gemmatimonadales bacterium]